MLSVFPTSSLFFKVSRQALPNTPRAIFYSISPISILLGAVADPLDSPFSAPWVVPLPLSSHALVLPTELPNQVLVFQQWVFSDQTSSLRVSSHKESFVIGGMRTYANPD